MNSIGIHIDSLPFKLNKFEAVLLFQEYPTTMVYQDVFGNPIIREWVDVSDNYDTNQYFYYKTSKVLLKQFIEGQLPHVDLINNALDAIVFYEEKKSYKSEFTVAPTTWIPTSHKPINSFYFKKEDGVDLLPIIFQFSLGEIELGEIAINQAKEISKSKDSETLFIHLNKGKGVGFGTANTDVLAKTLLKFDEFYKEVALDYKLGINRGDVDLTTVKSQEYLPLTTTEVYGNIAASFAILLRPKYAQQKMIFGASDSEEISKSVFALIGNSETTDKLREEYPLHSEYTIKKYKSFVKEIYKQELNINISWFSPVSETEFTNKIDYIKANKIDGNLEDLTIETSDKFTVKGKFRSVNCDTGHYIFISTGGEKFSGYFDNLVREFSVTITFIDVYEITVNRIIKKEAGKQDGKPDDTIAAFLKDGE